MYCLSHLTKLIVLLRHSRCYHPNITRSQLFIVHLITGQLTLKYSISSGCCGTYSEIPASAFSRSLAAIFTPWAPTTSLWVTYWFLTRSSFRGWGMRRALTCATIGPSIPAKTIVSPSRRVPFTRMTSIVVPRPGRALTCKTHQCGHHFVDQLLHLIQPDYSFYHYVRDDSSQQLSILQRSIFVSK